MNDQAFELDEAEWKPEAGLEPAAEGEF